MTKPQSKDVGLQPAPIPVETSASVTVNEPPVTMWDEHGSIQVVPGQVELRLSQGWRLAPHDPPGTISELIASLKAAIPACQALYDETVAAGEVSLPAEVAASTALGQALDAFERLRVALYALHATPQQGEHAVSTLPNGTAIHHDPGQVVMHQALTKMTITVHGDEVPMFEQAGWERLTPAESANQEGA